MKYFKHDSDASLDGKLRKLHFKFGMEGYGFYWYCLELIARSVTKNNLNFELEDDAQVLAHYCALDADRVAQILDYMVEIELLELDGETLTCPALSGRTDEYTAKLIRSAQCTDNIQKKSVLKEKNRKEIIYSAFCAFWLAYPRKKDKSRAENSFTKIFKNTEDPKALLDRIIDNVNYRLSSGEWRLDQKKYIPLPSTYLNGQNWEDEPDAEQAMIASFPGDDYL